MLALRRRHADRLDAGAGVVADFAAADTVAGKTIDIFFFPHLSMAATGGAPTGGAAGRLLGESVRLERDGQRQTYQSDRLMRNVPVDRLQLLWRGEGTPDQMLAASATATNSGGVAYFQASGDGRALQSSDIATTCESVVATIKLRPQNGVGQTAGCVPRSMVPRFELDVTFGSTTLADVNF